MGEAAIRYLLLIGELGNRVEGQWVSQHQEAQLAAELERLWNLMTDDEHRQVEERISAMEAS